MGEPHTRCCVAGTIYEFWRDEWGTCHPLGGRGDIGTDTKDCVLPKLQKSDGKCRHIWTGEELPLVQSSSQASQGVDSYPKTRVAVRAS